MTLNNMGTARFILSVIASAAVGVLVGSFLSSKRGAEFVDNLADSAAELLKEVPEAIKEQQS